MARPAAGQAAGEHVEHQAQAEPLVRLRPAHRQDRAGRRLVQHRRVGGRLPLAVEQPALGHRLLAVEVMDADLALGRHAGPEVEHHRVGLGRDRGAERIRPQPRLEPSRGRHPLPGAVVVDRGDQDQPLGGGPLGVLAQPADVAEVPARAGRQAQLAGLGDHQVEQPVRLDLAQPPVAVDDHDGGRVDVDRQLGPGLVVPLAEEVDVLREPEDAVRVVAPEVGADEVAGDGLGVVLGHAGGDEEAGGEVLERRGVEDRHGCGPRGPGRMRESDLTRRPTICNPMPARVE